MIWLRLKLKRFFLIKVENEIAFYVFPANITLVRSHIYNHQALKYLSGILTPSKRIFKRFYLLICAITETRNRKIINLNKNVRKLVTGCSETDFLG